MQRIGINIYEKITERQVGYLQESLLLLARNFWGGPSFPQKLVSFISIPSLSAPVTFVYYSFAVDTIHPSHLWSSNPSFPFWLGKEYLFGIGSSFIRVTYPANFNLFILAFLTTSVSYIVYIAELCLLHLPFSCISPKIQGKILSNKREDFSSLFVMTQVSNEYVRRLNRSD